jgi:hypothetical protein
MQYLESMEFVEFALESLHTKGRFPVYASLAGRR